jgi:HAMP domain-containing protein
MADIDVVKKPARPVADAGTSRTITWALALLAVLAVAGLMAWLAVQSDRISTAAVVQEDAQATPAAGTGAAAGGAEATELGAVAATPETYVGRRVRVDGVDVAATLGPSAFWGDVPGANPFLVLFSPNLTQAPQLDAGQTYNIEGVVNAVTETELDNWVQSGAIRPGARDEASFATHYILVEQMNR